MGDVGRDVLGSGVRSTEVEAMIRKMAGYKYIDFVLFCSVVMAFWTLLIISTIA